MCRLIAKMVVIAIVLLCFNIGYGHATEYVITVHSADGDLVQFPAYCSYLSPLLTQGTNVDLTREDLVRIREWIAILPDTARDVRKMHVPVSQIGPNTIFVNELVFRKMDGQINRRGLLNVFRLPMNNHQLKDLFSVAHYLEIRPLTNALARVIANRLGMPVPEQSLRDQLRGKGFGPCDESQCAYIQKHYLLRMNNQTERTIADYLGLHGYASVLKNGQLLLDSKGITNLYGIDLIPGVGAIKNILLRSNYILGHKMDPDFPETPFQRCKKVTWLVLDYNRLQEVPQDFLEGLESLKTFDMASNQLAHLPARIFESVPTLAHLDLEFNQLKELDENVFLGLTNLWYLSLRGNHLVTLPAKLFPNSPNLFHVNLGNNRLTSLPDQLIHTLAKLRFLTLDGNQLSHIPPNFFDGLHRLRWISVKENCFKGMVGCFRKGSNLSKHVHIDFLPQKEAR